MDPERLILAGIVVFTAILVASITLAVIGLIADTILEYILYAIIILAGSILVFLALAYIAQTPALQL